MRSLICVLFERCFPEWSKYAVPTSKGRKRSTERTACKENLTPLLFVVCA